MKIVSVLAVAVFTLAACGDDDDGTSGGASTSKGASSCDISNDVGYCVGFAADQESNAGQLNCDSAKSLLGYNGIVGTSCPTANSVGSCAYDTPSGQKATYRYYSPKFTSDTAKTNCDHLPGTPGTFTAG